MEKTDIQNIYFENEEVRTNKDPYIDYFNVINNVLGIDSLDGFCDVGCSTGFLLEKTSIEFPNNRLLGIDFFQYQKDNCPERIRDNFLVHDMREPVTIPEKFDIVNCTELAEHIDKTHVDVLIENLKTLSSKYIILTWSKHGGVYDIEHDPHCQHLNPLEYNEYLNLMRSFGLEKNEMITEKLLIESKQYDNFSWWWAESIVVWEKIK